MKRKLFAFIIAFLLILPCAFALTGCGGKSLPDYVRISATVPDTFWVEYSSTVTDNSNNLYTCAKVTSDENTYYYLRYTNKGAQHEYYVVVDVDESIDVYVYDYPNTRWVAVNISEGTTWFDWYSNSASGYASTALGVMENTGDINSLLRYENGNMVEDKGLKDYELTGISGHVDAETIECKYFYDNESGEEYYFANDGSNMMISNPWSYGHSAKVYKRSFTMQEVIEAHNRATTGLPAFPTTE